MSIAKVKSLPTLTIQHATAPDGFAVINADELTDEHILFDEKAEAARRKVSKLKAGDDTKNVK